MVICVGIDSLYPKHQTDKLCLGLKQVTKSFLIQYQKAKNNIKHPYEYEYDHHSK